MSGNPYVMRSQVTNMPGNFDNVSNFLGGVVGTGIDAGGGIYTTEFNTTVMTNGPATATASARPSVGSPIAQDTNNININNGGPV